MNKLTKKALRMAVIFIPLGILLIIFGVVTGAKKGVYIESGKIYLDQDKDYNYENYDITGVKDISVDVSYAKIVIEESSNDKFGIAVNLSSSVEEPTVDVENDVLKVKKSDKFGINIFTWDLDGVFDENSNSVIIYVPKGTTLSDVTLHTSDGRIEISNLTVKDMKADSSNGAITTNNVVVSGSTSFTTSNGRVEIAGIFSNTTYVKTSNGKIIGDGTFKGKTTFKTSNGAVTLNNNIRRDDCNIVADTSNGSIKINDSKVGDDYKENNGGSNSIDLDSSNGSITIDFN